MLLTDSLEGLLHLGATRWPTQNALKDQHGTLTYAELFAQVQQRRSQLQVAGLQPGDRMMLQLPKQRELVIELFAAWSLGALVVPVHQALKPQQLQYIVQDCSPRLVSMTVTRRQQLAAEFSLPAGCDWFDSADHTADLPQHNSVAQAGGMSAQPAAILYTSGSTGMPKGVVLSQLNLLLGAASVSQYLGLQSSDVVLALLPFSFDYGLNQLLSAFSVGATVVLLDYLLTQDVVRQVQQYQVTVLAAVPPLWAALADARWPDGSTAQLRLWTNSGGAMPPVLLKRLQ